MPDLTQDQIELLKKHHANMEDDAQGYEEAKKTYRDIDCTYERGVADALAAVLAAVERLLKTADGVAVSFGDKVWFVDPDFDTVAEWRIDDGMPDYTSRFFRRPFYFTEAAARAAAEKGGA